MNAMSKIYIGYVVEPIYQDNRITFELRVRVPSIHGTSSQNGVRNEDLPIAKPLFIPGLVYNQKAFLDALESINKVYVVFESGQHRSPVYLGLKGNHDLYQIPIETEAELAIDDTLSVEGESFGEVVV